MATNILTAAGEEFTVKNTFDGATITVGVYNDSVDAITDADHDPETAITTEPSTGDYPSYARQSTTVSAAETSADLWGVVNDTALTFTFDGTASNVVDAFFVTVSFNSAYGGGTGDWLIATAAMNSSRDLGSSDGLTVPAGNFEINYDEPAEAPPGETLEGFTWDQIHADTSWLTDADANGTLTVETVTNLNADGAGSLAAACEAAETNTATIVVFEVGGVIDRERATYLRTHADNLYIAGQTAPTPGITMIRGGIRIHGDNTIIQHVTFFPGDDIEDPHAARAVTYNQDGSNVVCDHVTAGWAPDTNVNMRDSGTNNAFINGIIPEALNESSHPEAPHGYGYLIRAGNTNATCIGNLLSHNWKRNIKPNENCSIIYANNYIWDWGDRVWHGSDTTSQCDWIGTTVEEGPSTNMTSLFSGTPGDVYFSNNNLIPSDMPLGDSDIEYQNDPMFLPGSLPEEDLLDPSELEDFIVTFAGSRPADRDSHNQRVIDNFKNRAGGIIDNESDVGGYPNYSTTTRSLDPPSSPGILDWLEEYTAEVMPTE